MKRFAILLISTLFAEHITLDNQTQNPKVAIQWADSSKEVDAYNKALIYGSPFDGSKLLILRRGRNRELSIPQNAKYFRVVAWSNNEKAPDLSTNWIDMTPGETYTLKQDHLTPVVLMSGMGC